MDGEEPLHGGGSRGHPHPTGPTDLLPQAQLFGDQREPDLRRGMLPSTGMLDRGLRRKPVPQNRGDERSPRSARQRLVIWSVNIGRGFWGGGRGGKRDSGRGFI